ncbi:MAG: hypothetical protein ACHQNV_00900 [Vicinamibacteria bacterium]
MTRTVALPIVLGLLGWTVPSFAQGNPGNITAENVEIIPFAGYRTGGGLSGDVQGVAREFGIDGSASYGGAIDFNLHQGNFKIEALYSRQTSKIDSAGLLVPNGVPLHVEYLQAGVLQETGTERGRFYISVLLGATRFDPEGFDSATKFSASIGGGLKLFPSSHIGLRFDARAFLTFVNGETGGVCAGGTCLFVYSGSHLWQGDFTGGLILAF